MDLESRCVSSNVDSTGVPETRITVHIVVGRCVNENSHGHAGPVTIKRVCQNSADLFPPEIDGRADFNGTQVLSMKHELAAWLVSLYNGRSFETNELRLTVGRLADVHADIG